MDNFKQDILQIERMYKEINIHSPSTSDELRDAQLLKVIHKVIEKYRPLENNNWLTFSLLCGKVLNKCDTYQEEARNYFFSILQHNPSLSEAWLELGICLSKKPDIGGAIQCFERSLECDHSAEAVCQYSIALRTLANSSTTKKEERMKLLERAETAALECVDRYPEYGPGHSSLGTSLLLKFFNSAQRSPEIMEKAINSYSKALSCNTSERSTHTESDLHNNLATALRFKEDFSGAIKHYKEAIKIDGSSEGSTMLSQLLSYLTWICSVVEKGLKTTKYNRLLNRLKPSESFVWLSMGRNVGKTLSAVVIATSGIEVPTTVIAADKDKTLFVVTVFNCSGSFGLIIGDLISISDPMIKTIEISSLIADKKGEVKFVRVSNPTCLTRNGVRFRLDYVTPVQLTVKSSISNASC